MSLNRDDLDWIMSHICSIEEHLKKVKDYISKEEDILIAKNAKQCIITCTYPNNPELDSHRCTGKAHRFGKCKECLGLEEWMD